MKLKTEVKQAGKKENRIVHAELILDRVPETVRELIVSAVKATRNAFLYKKAQAPEMLVLSREEIENRAASGKIGFDFIYNEKEGNEADAIETALQAFEDGLVAIFIDDKRYEDLNAPLNLTGDETLCFIKLAMLAGRMW